ncbi:MAG: right-handed parallel beta-helix repeat-containing protein [Pseudolysinimonas sp.]
MFRSLATGLVALLLAVSLAACSPGGGSLKVVNVPKDASTLNGAMELVAPGGEIVIAAGRYEEQLVVTKADVTIRGAERNATIIDGGGIRPYGIVGLADGVTIENLTVTGATFYGVLVTGLHDATGPANPGADGYTNWDPTKFPPLGRFLVDHVTAYNNGLYGIYAFNSNHGVIRDSYASGSADSGFYVGQCQKCDILVTGNVAERNAVGFENANASDSVVIVGNRFSGNRVGLTLLSSYQEAFTPQRANTVVGNLIANNTEADSPKQAEGGFATGIGIGGGQGNVITDNRITGNPRAAVILTNTEDIPATGNRFSGNVVDGDIAIANYSADRAAAKANCWEDGGTTAPEALLGELTAACGGDASPQSAAPATSSDPAPPGVSFRKVALPRAQPQLEAPANRARLPESVTMPDTAQVTVPDDAYLADRSGSQ